MTYFDNYNFKNLSDGGFDEKHQLILDEIKSIREAENCPDLVDILDIYTSREDMPIQLECMEIDVHREIDGSLDFFEEGFEYILKEPEDVFRIDFWRYWTFWGGICIYVIDKFSSKKWLYLLIEDGLLDDEMLHFEASYLNNNEYALLEPSDQDMIAVSFVGKLTFTE